MTAIATAMAETAEDEWADLRRVVRAFLAVETSPRTRPLGRHFDVVVTTAGTIGDRLLDLMDTVQPGGCGPVIAEEGWPLLLWLVPPRTVRMWENDFGVCLSAPITIDVPPMHHEVPPGPHWIRPFRKDVRVGPRLLHDALNAVRPEVTPHEAQGHLLGLRSSRLAAEP